MLPVRLSTAILTPELTVAAVIFLGVLGVSLAVSSLHASRSTLLEARLSRHTVRAATPPARLRRIDLLGQSAASTHLLARKLGSLTFIEASRRALIQANLRISAGRYYLFRVLLAMGAFLAVQVA